MALVRENTWCFVADVWVVGMLRLWGVENDGLYCWSF